jgi:hypothetical protein
MDHEAGMSFKRKTYEPPPSAPLKPLEKPPRYGAAELEPAPKETVLRSEAYRRYVASQECFGCRLVGFSQAAHENMSKGMAQKACDTRLFPLCTVHFGVLGCHEEYDLALDGLTRAARRAWASAMAARMLQRAESDGWRFTPEGIKAP